MCAWVCVGGCIGVCACVYVFTLKSNGFQTYESSFPNLLGSFWNGNFFTVQFPYFVNWKRNKNCETVTMKCNCRQEAFGERRHLHVCDL